jgi:hypothetical protein
MMAGGGKGGMGTVFGDKEVGRGRIEKTVRAGLASILLELASTPARLSQTATQAGFAFRKVDIGRGCAQ